MIQTVEKGKTILVDGPAYILLLSGEMSALGTLVKIGDKVIIRKGKRMPFETLSDIRIDLVLSDPAFCTLFEGSSIPSSWRDAVSKILSAEEHKVLVLGGTDSGKTSFCTYLANLALNYNHKIAIIDGDLGQSDIGPPGTIGLGFIQSPILDLFNVQPEDAVFVGVTTPSRATEATLDAFACLKAKAMEMDADFLIFNTDGWIEGPEALSYKSRLARVVVPDIVLGIKSNDELRPVLDALDDLKVLLVDSSQAAKRRDRETRKAIRESAYKRYLRGAKVRTLPLNWVRIETERNIRAEPRRPIPEADWKPDLAPAMEDREREQESEHSRDLELVKGIATFQEDKGEGALVGMVNDKGKFLGIGTIHSVDVEKGVIRIITPVEDASAKIYIGRIKLDEEGNEIELTPEVF